MAVFRVNDFILLDRLKKSADDVDIIYNAFANREDSEDDDMILNTIELVGALMEKRINKVHKRLSNLMLESNNEHFELYDRIAELEAEIAEMRKTEEKFNRLPAYVTPKIVAEHFNVSRYKVAKMQKKGILPEPRKHGRNRYWHKSVIRGLEL